MHPDLVEYGPVRFHSDPNALYDRHLIFDYAIDPDLATPRERYEAVARSLRDVLALRERRDRVGLVLPAQHHPGSVARGGELGLVLEHHLHAGDPIMAVLFDRDVEAQA